MATRAEQDTLPRLAYDLSTRALERQEQVIDELRARSGVLIASSSLAASFLGGRAADEGWSVFGVLAVAAFVLSIAASLWVLLPKEGLIFALRGTVLLETQRERIPMDENYRRLTYWIEGYRDTNQPTINRLSNLYRLAVLAILGQVLLWVFEIVW
jgi:hypothetical protein